MKRIVISLMLTLSFMPVNTSYGMACCRAQGVEFDDETTERNQELANHLNTDDANRYVIENIGGTTNILRFHTRTDNKLWVLQTEPSSDHIILVGARPVIEGYQNNDQILCQNWQVKGLKKGTAQITFQERKRNKIISQVAKTITVLESKK